MAIETPTWGWWSKSASIESGTTDLQGNYNGFNFTLGGNTTVHGYGDMVMVDGDENGTISAVQSTNSPAPANGDRFQTPDGVNRQIYELAIYDNSTYTYTDANGDTQTYTARAVVYQLGNGDLVVRMRDDDRNLTPSDFYIENVTNIQLGQWDGTKYGNTIVANFDEPPPNICFTSGTKILTQLGEIAVENLKVGDYIFTKDNGFQQLRWIGRKKFDRVDLSRFDKLRPIRIAAGALGNETPEVDLLVSPQHRILAKSKIAQRMFGTEEVLVAAKHLLSLDGVEIANDVEDVEYFHLLFNQHEILIANGAEAESLYTGAEAMKAVGSAAVEEIFTIFPELRSEHYSPLSARMAICGREGRKLADRHQKHRRPLVV